MSHPSPEIVLASASPRRVDLLGATGLQFEQCVSDVDEDGIEADSNEEFARMAATLKGNDVLARLDSPAIVIGADTIVCVGDARLGKPADREEARRMLRGLENRDHRVLTGVAICAWNVAPRVDSVSTVVRFGAIPEADLEAYLDTEEPWDKAGAYAIQGWAGEYIERIEGDWHNVVGLPLTRLLEMLSHFVDISRTDVPPPPVKWR